jgi:DHA2 family multidrug resistance protein
MRNLGGAIGLALIDTVIFGRSGDHGRALTEKLMGSDATAAAFVGLSEPPDPMQLSPEALMHLQGLIEKASLTLAINDGWAMTAGLVALGMLLAPAARADDQSSVSR